MEILIWGLAVFGAYTLWKSVIKPRLLGGHIPFATNRGLLAVKASAYLMMLEGGGEPDQANAIVQDYDEDMHTGIILEATEFIQRRYGGKQLPMIADARAKGFQG